MPNFRRQLQVHHGGGNLQPFCARSNPAARVKSGMHVYAVLTAVALWSLLQFGGGYAAPSKRIRSRSGAYKYALRPGLQMPFKIFGVKVQQTLLSIDEPYPNGMATALDNAPEQGLSPNQALAAYFKQVLNNGIRVEVLNKMRIDLRFAVLVVDARVVAHFRSSRNEEIWIPTDEGTSSENFSAGLAHWPTRACRMSEHQVLVNPKDYPLGRPCGEGGALPLKNEMWLPAVSQPKNVMVFYLPSERVLLKPKRVPKLIDQVDSCISTLATQPLETPIDTTVMAKCMRGEYRPKWAVTVTAESLANNLSQGPLAQDSHLSGFSIEEGSMYVDHRVITVSVGGQPVGQMKLLIILCPFYPDHRYAHN